MEFDQNCHMDQYFLFIADYYSSTWNDLRLTIHPLKGIRAVTTFWLVQIDIFCYKHLCIGFCVSIHHHFSEINAQEC